MRPITELMTNLDGPARPATLALLPSQLFIGHAIHPDMVTTT